MAHLDDTYLLTTPPWKRTRSVTSHDAAAMAGLRAMVLPNKGQMQGPSARAAFDAIMMRVPAPEGVAFEAGEVGGIAGWWCRLAGAVPRCAILHLHGGWYNWGTAQAFRHLAGHIAARAGADAFIPDYALAPEHPFPAAPLDVQSCYQGLIDAGCRVAVVGDSAGGGLALGLLSSLAAQSSVMPVGTVALSPVTDLAFTGESWSSRAAADPYFTSSQVAELAAAYLGDHDPADPLASPLYADLTGLPPICVHVGADEVLLDDSRRYVARAVAAGVDATLDIWTGMPHGFASGVGKIAAADAALGAIGTFLARRFHTAASTPG